MAGLEYSYQSNGLHQILLLMALIATMTGGGLVATTRAAWGWWK